MAEDAGHAALLTVFGLSVGDVRCVSYPAGGVGCLGGIGLNNELVCFTMVTGPVTLENGQRGTPVQPEYLPQQVDEEVPALRTILPSVSGNRGHYSNAMVTLAGRYMARVAWSKGSRTLLWSRGPTAEPPEEERSTEGEYLSHGTDFGKLPLRRYGSTEPTADYHDEHVPDMEGKYARRRRWLLDPSLGIPPWAHAAAIVLRPLALGLALGLVLGSRLGVLGRALPLRRGLLRQRAVQALLDLHRPDAWHIRDVIVPVWVQGNFLGPGWCLRRQLPLELRDRHLEVRNHRLGAQLGMPLQLPSSLTYCRLRADKALNPREWIFVHLHCHDEYVLDMEGKWPIPAAPAERQPQTDGWVLIGEEAELPAAHPNYQRQHHCRSPPDPAPWVQVVLYTQLYLLVGTEDSGRYGDQDEEIPRQQSQDRACLVMEYPAFPKVFRFGTCSRVSERPIIGTVREMQVHVGPFDGSTICYTTMFSALPLARDTLPDLPNFNRLEGSQLRPCSPRQHIKLEHVSIFNYWDHGGTIRVGNSEGIKRYAGAAMATRSASPRPAGVGARTGEAVAGQSAAGAAPLQPPESASILCPRFRSGNLREVESADTPSFPTEMPPLTEWPPPSIEEWEALVAVPVHPGPNASDLEEGAPPPLPSHLGTVDEAAEAPSAAAEAPLPAATEEVAEAPPPGAAAPSQPPVGKATAPSPATVVGQPLQPEKIEDSGDDWGHGKRGMIPESATSTRAGPSDGHLPAIQPPAGDRSAPGSAAARPTLAWAQRGPQAMTPDKLREMWTNQSGRRSVIGFYGHKGDRTGYECFSNFFDQTDCPFDFVVPREVFAFPVDERDRMVKCTFSEKSIMLYKAAVMGDRDSYKKIAEATTPAAAKKLGRSVRGFDDNLWNRVVCTVALDVVHQKFSKTSSIREVLLGTGQELLAEATSDDRIWGIGIDLGDERVQTPARWQGTNILGWALMEAREALQCGVADPGRLQPGSPGLSTRPRPIQAPGVAPPPSTAPSATTSKHAGTDHQDMIMPSGTGAWTASPQKG